MSLREVLAAAYGMSLARVIGPGWLDKDRFDTIAKSPPGVPDTQLQPMLQTLLKERFKLTAHLETRELPVYYLVIAKDGVKMPVYPAQDHGPAHPENRPVIDRTGSTERYNVPLSFAPLSPQAPAGQG
jgi:uncharacterized protein (TIGR03435 family)